MRDAARTNFPAADRLTASRLATAPLLVAAAAMDMPRIFFALAAWGLVSDVADGVVARALHQESERGARLDSRADLACYSALLVGLALIMPERLIAEWRLLAVVVLSYAVPILVGWAKFRALTSYHTVLARVALAGLVLGLLVWLVFDAMLLLRVAIVVLALSAVEELLITLKLDAPHHSVAHLFSRSIPSQRTHDPCRPDPSGQRSVSRRTLSR